jgi:DNA topoisomerase-1
LNIAFELNKDMESSEEINTFLQGTIYFQHTLTCSSPIKKWYSSPQPFTTSKIQQTCSNELHLSPKETMRICQTLYEKGFITYMRTDSTNYSNEFIELCHKYIINKYDEKYINKDLIKPNNSLEKEIIVKAHEAIRPTDISIEDLPHNLTFDSKERKVYKLIWQNTLESLMTKSCYYSIEAKIVGFQKLLFLANREIIHFPGWKIVKNKFEITSKEYNYLLESKPNQFVKYNKIISNIHIQETKSHYTEAKLIQTLEEKGIGRPSTFASLVEKIQEREYIKKENVVGKTIDCLNYELNDNQSIINEIILKKEFGNEKNKLIIQPLGTIVLDFLEKYFEELFNYNYTKQMED